MTPETLSPQELSQWLRLFAQTENAPDAPLFLANPPVESRGTIGVTVRPGNLLSTFHRRHGYGSSFHWVKERLNQLQFFTLIQVMEGAADIVLGITKAMAAANPQLSKRNSRYVISLPTHSVLVVPQGLPISDASGPHWERQHLEQARSRLLWFHISPSGASIHTCRTSGKQHSASPAIFVSDLQLEIYAEALGEELRGRAPHYEALARLHFQTLLLRIERELTNADLTTGARASERGGMQAGAVADNLQVVQRAYRFIETHLNEPLDVPLIAARAHVSTSHLNRLFQTEQQCAVMEYVTRRRLERAEALLLETELPVRRICQIVGYQRADSFGRLFARSHGISPAVFRRRNELKRKPWKGNKLSGQSID